MALNFLAVANKGLSVATAADPDPTTKAVLGVAKFVTGAAQKILIRKKERAQRKAEEARLVAYNKDQYADQVDKLLGRVSTVTGITASPIKTSGKLLAMNLGGLENKAMQTGAVLVPSSGPGTGKSMTGLIIGIIAAVFLLPKLLKGRR